MSIAVVVRRMAEAGAPPEAIAIAVEAIEAVSAADEARRTKRAEQKRRERSRDTGATVARQSSDNSATVAPTVPPEVPSPLSPKDNISNPLSPHLPTPLHAPLCARAPAPDPREAGLRIAIAAAYLEIGNGIPPDTGRAAVWLAQGRDPAIILATIRSILPRKPRATLSYFDGPIADAHALQAASPGAKATGPPGKSFRDPMLSALAEIHRKASNERPDANLE